MYIDSQILHQFNSDYHVLLKIILFFVKYVKEFNALSQLSDKKMQ